MMKKIIILVCIILLTGCNNKEYSTNLFYMDTLIQVKLYNINEKKANEAFEKIENIYSKYQNIADNYDENSELYKVNNSPNQTINISDELKNLINFGLDWNKKSDLLNINIGKLTKLWTDVRNENKKFPTNEQLNMNIDISNIKLINNKITTNENTNIDLGAITKGYVTELAGNYLENIGIDYYIINAGGNVKVGKSDKGYYNIGIASPIDKNDTFEIVKGENTSVVTSGGYERFFEYNGTLYHHIINPNTKYPSNNMKSVTIVGKDSSICDALSTILFLMDIDEGKEFVKDYDVKVIWYTNDNKLIKSDNYE